MSSESNGRSRIAGAGPPSGAGARSARARRRPGAPRGTPWRRCTTSRRCSGAGASATRSSAISSPSLRTSAEVLREASSSRGGDARRRAADGARRTVRLRPRSGHGLRQAARRDQPRRRRARGPRRTRAPRWPTSSEASTDLLALLDRAASPAPTEVSLQLVVREPHGLWGGARAASSPSPRRVPRRTSASTSIRTSWGRCCRSCWRCRRPRSG